MKFTAYWYRYPRGIPALPLEVHSREFTDYEAACAFLRSKSTAIQSNYWAGGDVDDEDGFYLYIIDDQRRVEEISREEHDRRRLEERRGCI